MKRRKYNTFHEITTNLIQSLHATSLRNNSIFYCTHFPLLDSLSSLPFFMITIPEQSPWLHRAQFTTKIPGTGLGSLLMSCVIDAPSPRLCHSSVAVTEPHSSQPGDFDNRLDQSRAEDRTLPAAVSSSESWRCLRTGRAQKSSSFKSYLVLV